MWANLRGLIAPLFAYLLIAVGLPFCNGAGERQAFVTHCTSLVAMSIAIAAAVAAVQTLIGICMKRTNRCS